MHGKFLFVGDRKLHLKGVTYGTFRPREDGTDYPAVEVVAADFAAMAASGVTAVRTYTPPPRWLLDAAHAHGLLVMVGLPWEQHVTFLDDRRRAADIVRRVREAARECAGHPALLAFAVGNEIPASIVRWHGRERVQAFIRRLYRAVKAEDPDALVTYVNFPSTEYLELPFLDFQCFNVYLEQRDRLEAYLARLHTLAGDQPLVMAEIGLDSRRNGVEQQAEALAWQVEAVFAAGCAGAFVFSWTDEWHRGGFDIEDWDFGLVDRERRPKPALRAVADVFARVPFAADVAWPRISVVVCSYNGAATIADTMEGLRGLDYPDFEVIVVDDGSSDDTAAIASRYDARVIRTENRGLSAARNTGAEAATGEIVAYIDDDAYPDPEWLRHLAHTFMTGGHAACGGPNIAPPGDGWIADCVANAPGGPIHVLLDDRTAEHVPGCNLAVRRDALQAIGGFDTRFRAAGDDVDVGWRLQGRGGTIGFSPAAVVWHHRRNSARTYARQQRGYGRAEALLERKWPEKYNRPGHVAWAGRLYGPGLRESLATRRGRVYFGSWNSAPFQAVYRPREGLIAALPAMPEWYLATGTLALLSALGILWPYLLLALPLLLVAVGVVVAEAAVSASHADFPTPRGRLARLGMVAFTALLYLVQPAARLYGRLELGLTPWRRRGLSDPVLPRRRRVEQWSETWRAPEDRLRGLLETLENLGAVTRRGGDFDDWDLQVRGGWLAATRIRLALEEHGGGRQLVRYDLRPKEPVAVPVTAVTALVVLAAVLDREPIVATVLAILGGMLALSALRESAAAMGAAVAAVRAQEERDHAAEDAPA